jgi:hypothetical protein
MRRQATRGKNKKSENRELIPTFQKDLKVDRAKFEGIVKNLLNTSPTKREDVKVSKKKPEKLIPPQK